MECLVFLIIITIMAVLPYIIISIIVAWIIKIFIKRKKNESIITPVKNYIIANRNTFSRIEIEEVLLNAGWKKEQVESAFKEIK